MEYLARGLEQPHREAVADASGTWTYEELLGRSGTIAARLMSQGRLNPGDRVGIFLTRRKESVALFLGVLGAGGVAVPFSARGAGREIAHQIVDADISHIIAEPTFKEVLAEASALACDRGVKPRLLEAELLLKNTSTARSLDLVADAPALILYTSGTTGQPKGVVHTHASLLAQVDVLSKAWEWSAEDRLLHVLPLHHIHGLVNGLFGALRAGAGLRFLDAFSPADVWKEFTERRVSVFYAVPTIYHQLADAWDRQDPDTQRRWAQGARQLRLAVSGSAALPARLWTRWRDITGQALLERYGMTEIGMAISNPYRGERRPGTVGQPLPGMRVRLVTESGEDAPDGTPGEILVQGPALFREYWNKPEATRASFRDGWFLTGDIAEIQNGYIRICGRASVDILKSAGYKISALEIEEALREHPAVREVAVVGVPDVEWGEIVTACVVPQPGQSLELDQVRAWCKDKLAPYKAPRRLELRQELPRNAMGKVTKPDLIRQLTVIGSLNL
jgi:malonyl-CoA/methylmalonyl-CoA synthetase